MSPTEAMKAVKETLVALKRERDSLQGDDDLIPWLDRLAPLHERLFAAVRELRDTKIGASKSVENWAEANDLKRFLEKFNFDAWLEPAKDEDFWDEMFPVTVQRYFDDLLEASCFINDAYPPPEFVNLLNEAKQCYALRKFNAVCCLCRAVLEKTVRDISIRTGRISEERFNLSVDDDNYPRFFVCLKATRARESLWQATYGLYDELCGVVHGSREATRSNAHDALDRAVAVVTQLYQLNRHDLQQ